MAYTLKNGDLTKDKYLINFYAFFSKLAPN
jgi:hypothetical protein